MKQPELGKKIAELRKAKGFTQEELVAKCNLNVRTLQRIEAGEVTPRSYTIKIIFAVLDYRVFDSSNTITNRFIRAELVASKWLGQLFKYVLDLFNLKTNTMKKLMILSVPFLVIFTFLLFSYNSNVKAQARLAIKDKFEKVNSKFIQWFNTRQIDSVASQYHEKACMMPDQYQTLYNRKNIQEYYQQLYNTGLRFSQLKPLSKVMNDSIAVERGTWSMSINSKVVATGTYMSQWRYEHGNWLIENEMSKSDAGVGD